jgi:lipoprotein-anchoring transpeptidase ErfK/SrfK
VLAVATLAAACSVAPASGSPAAVATGPSATPTLNPNQLELLRRSLGITPETLQPATPAATPTAAIDGTPPPGPTPSPFAPDLEAMLPSAIDGVPLQRFSAPASLYDTGGDMCFLLCPGEPTRLAKAAGVPVEKVTVGVAFPPRDSTIRAGVIAIRFDGIDPKRSPVDVRIKAGGHTTPYSVDGLVARTMPLKMGSRTVTWVTWPAFYQPEQGEYLLSSGDVLFIVAGMPPGKDGKVPDDVRKLVEALPGG